MSQRMTPQEHDDMRDLVVAATQRQRPAARGAWIAGAIAVLLVAAVVAGVATALSLGPADSSPANPYPTPTFTQSGEAASAWPAVPPPAEGTHLTLQPVAEYDERLIMGTGAWLENQGIDIASAQGFESIGTIHPWTANLADGTGKCILIRKNYTTGGWFEVVCDEPGVPASVEREMGGVVLRFTISGDVVDVYAVPR